MPWVLKAREKWGPHTAIIGYGAYAFLTHCEGITVTLCKTQEEAAEKKARLDRDGCCKACKPSLHEILVLFEGAAPLCPHCRRVMAAKAKVMAASTEEMFYCSACGHLQWRKSEPSREKRTW
jgi:hypothetical protein